MFVVELRQGVYAPDAILIAKTDSYAAAIRFVESFCEFGVIAPTEQEIDAIPEPIHDWIECWYTDPLPPVARMHRD
jgi:hypothetical protein